MSTIVQSGVAEGEAAVKIKRKAKQRSLRNDNLMGYLFIAPWLIGFLGFTLLPMAAHRRPQFHWLAKFSNDAL
jgi:hypothetical protein